MIVFIRPGGRVWLVFRLFQIDIPTHRFAVNAGQFGNLTVGISLTSIKNL